MKRPKIAEIIDFVFINLLVFLILFVWAKYFNRNILLSILISLVLVLVFNLIRSFVLSKKKNKQQITKNLEEDIEQYMLTLLSNTKEETLLFFTKLLEVKQIKIDNENNFILIESTKTVICPMFDNKELQVESCLKLLNKIFNQHHNKIIFLCVSCNPKTKAFLEKLKNKEVKVYEKNQVYLEFLEPYNYYPKIMFEYKKGAKLNYKELLNISFNKKRAKGYFFSGVLIFFCSFIVRHNFYYVFMSSLLFLFALICILKKEASSPKDFF